MRKTKIICTLGPATDDPAVLRELIRAGMNVARLNFSHGTHADHLKRITMIKEARAELGVPLAVMLDTKGPEIRIKTFRDGPIELSAGDTFTLTTREAEGTRDTVSITHPSLPAFLKPGNAILLNDGLIELKVERLTATDVVCRVVYGGPLSDRKSMNLPGIEIDMPYLSDADKSDILFGIANDVDYLACSFVRCEGDVRLVRGFIDANGGGDVDIIAKIENRQGVDNIDSIIRASDGIMVARGDMGVEIPYIELPAIQKQIIKKCYYAGKKVITATQMLESMINSPRPTRAEASDVANAVYDGTSATMLSGETAAGRYPVQVVRAMAAINSETEDNIHYKKRFKALDPQIANISDAVSHATCSAADDLNAAAIIVVTRSGKTARMISRFRPQIPIIAAVTDAKAYNKLSINWGIYPVMAELQPDTDALFRHAADKALATGLVKRGDIVTITAGIPVGVSGNTNILKIEIV
ncbi:MAG: pyruvate kinase [Clostridiales bacterium]|jgi:pyruvate kinase|nr:pyruvate kinase [Clostridiales bacterium]